MAVGVVDVLEVIHVQHDRAQALPLGLTFVVKLLGMLEKRPSTLQAGQFIGLCGAG
ncbi:hypothetical protein D3C84_1005130 [compost metagenome]